MTYTKPEIHLLGKAAQLIQIFQKAVPSSLESTFPPDGDPAYDLDE